MSAGDVILLALCGFGLFCMLVLTAATGVFPTDNHLLRWNSFWTNRLSVAEAIDYFCMATIFFSVVVFLMASVLEMYSEIKGAPMPVAKTLEPFDLTISQSDGTYTVDVPAWPGSPAVGRGNSMLEAMGDWLHNNQSHFPMTITIDPSVAAGELQRRKDYDEQR